FRITRSRNYRAISWGRGYRRVGLRRLEEWLFLNGQINRLNPDVFFGPSNFLPLRKTCPMVVTIHDMTFFEHPEFLPPVRRWYWHQWTHRTIALADAILTDTEASKRDIVRHGSVNPTRITVVPLGTGAA